MPAVEGEDGEEDAGVGFDDCLEGGGVCGGIVGHEEGEEDEDYGLEDEGDPVYVSPVGVVGDDPGEDASEEDAECWAGGDDGDVEGPVLVGGQLCYKWNHDLGDACEER